MKKFEIFFLQFFFVQDVAWDIQKCMLEVFFKNLYTILNALYRAVTNFKTPAPFIIFFTKFHFFAISKLAKNQFLKWGKSLKLPKMQFHEKNLFELFDFTSFFVWTFSNFLARCLLLKMNYSIIHVMKV